MEAEAFSINFSLIVANSLSHAVRHLDFSNPHVEETLLSYMRVMSLLTLEHLSRHSCHASLLLALQLQEGHNIS